jgi:hypothetical protein
VSIQVRRISLATPPKHDRKKARKSALPKKKAAGKKPRTVRGSTEVSDRNKQSVALKAATPQKSLAPPTPSTPANLAQSRTAAQPPASPSEQLTIFTIGHSTHPIEEFIALLKTYSIEQLVDVRTVPKSRHVPQFNSEALADVLSKQGIGYVHLKALGGLRHAKKDSVNMGWRNASFRGYADYMSTDKFTQGIDRLIDLAKTKRTVIMCAEAVPWRCHRSLIGDALLVRGVTAEDIMSATSTRPHKLTEFAKVEGQQITYPADKNLELFSS